MSPNVRSTRSVKVKETTTDEEADGREELDHTAGKRKGFQILTMLGRSDEALSLHRRATIRTLVKQSDYRDKAAAVLEALPIHQSDRLQAQRLDSIQLLLVEQS